MPLGFSLNGTGLFEFDFNATNEVKMTAHRKHNVSRGECPTVNFHAPRASVKSPPWSVFRKGASMTLPIGFTISFFLIVTRRPTLYLLRKKCPLLC